EPHHDAKRMLVVRVAPLRGESGVERLFTAVPERRVADVMRQAQCLREILVEAECPGDDSPDLGNLKAMRQANPEMVAVRRNENLCLSSETPERDRMDDAVAVALERAARPAASFVLMGELASARRGRVGSVRRTGHGARARPSRPRLQRERMRNAYHPVPRIHS